jgi:hypothetical protein
MPDLKNLSLNVFSQENRENRPLISRPRTIRTSPDEQILLSVRREIMPIADDKKEMYISIAKNLASRSDVLDIGKCEKSTPFVLKLNLNQDFKILNSDNQEHEVKIGKEHIYKIAPGRTIDAKSDFENRKGVYGYVCDQFDGIVGFIYVE